MPKRADVNIKIGWFWTLVLGSPVIAVAAGLSYRLFYWVAGI